MRHALHNLQFHILSIAKQQSCVRILSLNCVGSCARQKNRDSGRTPGVSQWNLPFWFREELSVQHATLLPSDCCPVSQISLVRLGGCVQALRVCLEKCLHFPSNANLASAISCQACESFILLGGNIHIKIQNDERKCKACWCCHPQDLTWGSQR